MYLSYWQKLSHWCHSAILVAALCGALVAESAIAATFGTVVSIGGQAADIALDEARGVLYIANFTANRIDVMSTSNNTLRTSINVSPQPGSIALSRDGKYLVVAHFRNYTTPGTEASSLTVIKLNEGNSKQTFGLASPPLGVAFGFDNRALIATTTEILLFDPANGFTQTITTISDLTAKTLPVAPATFPPNILEASFGTSGDGSMIYGLTNTFLFSFDVGRQIARVLGYTSSPEMGPRVVSVNQDGSYFTAGWVLFDSRGRNISQFPTATGKLNVGSHLIDSAAGLIYAQVPSVEKTATSTPVLQVTAADNLTVLERLQLPQNLSGRSLMSADRNTMYAISDSGVTVLPIGTKNRARRLAASVEDVVFSANFCDRKLLSREFSVTDLSGASTPFVLTSSDPAVRLSPDSGVTPATITVTIDPVKFQSTIGTLSANIEIKSTAAVNLPTSVRVLFNNKEADQRGTVFNVPGKLVDLLADPARNRFYVLRQDTNEVLIFNGANFQQTGKLRTANTPTQMAITFDRRYLLIGHDNAQIAKVYDLDTLQPETPVYFPGGHYPRSIAVAGNSILAAIRNAGTPHQIDRVDMLTRSANPLTTLGIFSNDVNLNTVLTASPNGQFIFAAMADGTTLLYNAAVDSFTAGRKDVTSLGGAYAASDSQVFIAGNNLLDSSLVPMRSLDTGGGASSGFVFVDQFAFRTQAMTAAAPGRIQRVILNPGESVLPTRTSEAPLLGSTDWPFTRTLAILNDRSAIISLSQCGLSVLPWNYDAAIAPPKIERVVNSADLTLPVAPGGLVSVFGTQFNPASSQSPINVALAESCLTLNGIPLAMVMSSSTQINAQLPFNVEGDSVMRLNTPGGASDNFNLRVLSGAPAVFRSGTAGPDTGIATVIRGKNNQLVTLSNPIHTEDDLVIYLTGLGRTSPEIQPGAPAPYDPLARAINQPKVTLGGFDLPVFYAGLTPGQVGVYQINVLVPVNAPQGFEVPLTIRQGEQVTTLSVRVIR